MRGTELQYRARCRRYGAYLLVGVLIATWLGIGSVTANVGESAIPVVKSIALSVVPTEKN